MNKYHLVGIAGALIFLATRIYFDHYDYEGHRLDAFAWFYIPLSLMLFLFISCFYLLAQNHWIKAVWWFFWSLSGNWAFRFIWDEKNVSLVGEYLFMGLFFIGIFYQVYKFKKKKLL